MGQEIVYCFKCQKRIAGADYAKGLAFQLENQSCCSSCAVKVLDNLPPKDKELLLGNKGIGDQVSATLDGKPRPLRKNGQPLPGRVHLNSQNGSFRITAIDFRPAR